MARRKRAAGLGQALRRYFMAGVATLFPIAVTVYLLVAIFKIADGLLGRYLGFSIPGLGLIATVGIILIVGIFSVHFFGRVVFGTLEVWFSRMPLVKGIYPAVKQLTQFLFNDGKTPSAVRRVVLIQYPRVGVYTPAFVTHEMRTAVTGTSRNMVTVLIPTPPSPWSGPLLVLPEEEVIPLTMSVEQAIKLVVSGGVVSAPLQAARQPNG